MTLSVILGVLVWFTYGSLSKPAKAFFEGTATWLAVVVLSSMIFWMVTKGKTIKTEIECKIELIVTRGVIIGLTSLSFVVVFREELESVLFLTPFLVEDVSGTLSGAFLEMGIVLASSYSIFLVGMKINIRRFFYFTSFLLILLAGGLAGYGTHELIEYAEDVGVELGWPMKLKRSR